jgi:deazaflavin-dependent oxidoreductase (nitroreductase family)
MLAFAPPSGWLRLALKAPRWLYRLHLGWLLGHRFLLLTNRGRQSGRVYNTVLEVVLYEPATHESVVVSGWGDRADWYANIQETPALTIETGGERYVPHQRFLTPDEVYDALRDYLRRNRWATRIVSRLIGLRFDDSDNDRTRIGKLRGAAFCPARRLAAPRSDP